MKFDTTGISEFLSMRPIGVVDLPLPEGVDDPRILNPRFGKTHDAEARAAISAARKKCKATPEARANMSKAHLGKKHSEEALAKMRATKAANPFRHSDEANARIGEAARKRALGRKHSPESIAKMKEAHKRRRENAYDVG